MGSTQSSSEDVSPDLILLINEQKTLVSSFIFITHLCQGQEEYFHGSSVDPSWPHWNLTNGLFAKNI